MAERNTSTADDHADVDIKYKMTVSFIINFTKLRKVRFISTKKNIQWELISVLSYIWILDLFSSL